MKQTRFIIVPALFILISFYISSCSFQLPDQIADSTPTSAINVAPSSTSVPELRNLTICLGAEPNTLYPYGGPNSAARSVLAAIYDGPIDTIGYEYQPVILTQLPSLANGDAQISRTPVQAGGQIVDADGNLVLLELGVKYRPAGCRGDDCVVTYDGTSAVEMDQMVVTFRMRPDLTWSDGTPVTAEDSVFSYGLASDPTAIANTYLIDRTETYEAADATTIQWWGKPGFIDPEYTTNFWQPAPKHAWSEFPSEQLTVVDVSSRSPIGWGAYSMKEWSPNDHITLEKNPYYYRSNEGYPKFDALTFRFIPDPNIALTELVAGRCDILDPSIRLDNHAGLLQEMQSGGQASAFFSSGMTIEWLGLGVFPAAYDDGYDTLYQKDRANLFSETYTRQGIEYCLDRQSVVNNVLFGLTTVPRSYVPVEHPVYDANIDPTPFDPSVGISLLEQAGWKDTDNNTATPRVAVNVPNVGPNTPLLLNYYTTTATQRRQVAEILAASLAQCGIGLNVQYFSQNDLYAPGPDGALFGRKFDMIEYAMGVNGIHPPCAWFTSSEIPNASNAWIGTNVTGFQNAQFDAACRITQQTLPDEQAYLEAYRQTQVIFNTEMPAIPLYYRLRVAAARPDVCNFSLDPTANPLWNIEAIDKGEACK